MLPLYYKMTHTAYLRLFVSILLLLSTSILWATERDNPSRISLYGRNYAGRVLTANEARSSNWYMSYDVAVGFSTRRDSSVYAYKYGYPTWGVGIAVSRFSDLQFTSPSFMPDVYTVYASFHRQLVQRGRVTWGYNWETGITSSPSYYDPVGNPDNLAQSSFIMAYFGGGFYGTYTLGKQWQLGTELTYRHHSNGKLSLPNTGIDIIGASIFVRYALSQPAAPTYTKEHFAPFKRRMMVHLAVGGGVHSCDAEWIAYNRMVHRPEDKQSTFTHYPKLTLVADMLYRYSEKHATGIGLDLTCSTNMRQLEAAERIIYGDQQVNEGPGYSPLSVGVGIVQEFFWKNLAGYLSVGVYPYLHRGITENYGLYYQKAGARYYIPDWHNTFVGLAIKANDFVAEFFEFSIGKAF